MADNSFSLLGAYQRARRMILGALLVCVLAALLFVESVFPPETVMHEGIEMAGIVLIVLGIAGRLWSTLYIGGRKSVTVVRSGPYSIMRNPLYLFSSLAAAGVGAQTGSLTIAVLFAAGCAVAFHFVILREEKFLGSVMGADYQAYLAAVPRFFPSPRLYHEGAMEGFQPKLLLTTLLDGLVFLLAMPIFELIDAAQEAGRLPVLLYLP